jgi:hypothetical protein
MRDHLVEERMREAVSRSAAQEAAEAAEARRRDAVRTAVTRRRLGLAPTPDPMPRLIAQRAPAD